MYNLSIYCIYFQVKASGFIINPDLPWMWASPDGMVTCTCHADGVLEIKCPYNSRDCSLTKSCEDPSFCLGIGEDGTMALKTGHKFMYQVQAQMHVAAVSYCDHMIWTPQEFFLQRIQYDPVFFHNAYLKVVELIKIGDQNCWGNGIQHHSILPQARQPQNIHLNLDATVVNMVTQMTSTARLDSVCGSTFPGLALNWAGYQRQICEMQKKSVVMLYFFIKKCTLKSI